MVLPFLLLIAQALCTPPAADVNGDGRCNVADVAIVVGAVLAVPSPARTGPAFRMLETGLRCRWVWHRIEVQETGWGLEQYPMFCGPGEVAGLPVFACLDAPFHPTESREHVCQPGVIDRVWRPLTQ